MRDAMALCLIAATVLILAGGGCQLRIGASTQLDQQPTNGADKVTTKNNGPTHP